MRKVLFALFLTFCFTQTYSKGYALLVGAHKIAEGAYRTNYSLSAVKGSPTDVQRMKEILEMGGFETIKKLLGDQATKKNILTALNEIKKSISKDDVLVFYFSGHGDTLADTNKDELPYLFDQAFVTYDKFLVDDEMNAFWKSLPKGVKIYQIIDACFSGEMHKLFRPESLSTKFNKKANLERSNSTFGNCSGLDGTQVFDMYSVSSAVKNRTTSPNANGEGVMTADIYDLYIKFDRQGKLKNMTAAEFFEAVCSDTNGFMFLKIYPVVDVFNKDYVFKLN